MEFEWNATKARANLRAHGISFALAKDVFEDVFAIDRVDDRRDYGEVRFIAIGMTKARDILFVVYTERDGGIRIISARRAIQYEQDDYFEQNSPTDDSRRH